MDVAGLMRRCIALAEEAAQSGNYAVGSLVARDGSILAESGSTLIGADNDPTGHPEIQAIRAAAHQSGSRYLPGAVLVTTLEPCPMCTAAAIWAKLAGIAFGARQADAVAWSQQRESSTFTWRQIAVPADVIVAAATPRLELIPDVLRDECAGLFALNREH